MKKTKSRYSRFQALSIDTPFITRALLVVIALFLLTLFIDRRVVFKLIPFLAVVTAFNAWLQNFQLRRGIPTDFELSTFATVLLTVSFDLRWGLFAAVFTKLFASISSGNLIADHFFMILTYINAAIISSLFSTAPILPLGLTIVTINTVLMFLISKNILGVDPMANLSYTGTNFVFNLLVFSIFSQVVKALLA